MDKAKTDKRVMDEIAAREKGIAAVEDRMETMQKVLRYLEVLNELKDSIALGIEVAQAKIRASNGHAGGRVVWIQ